MHDHPRPSPRRAHLARAGLLAALVAAASACGDPSATTARVFLDLDPGVIVDQVRLQVLIDDQPVVTGLRPTRAGQPLPAGVFVDVLFADGAAGTSPRFLVAGLKAGAQTGRGEGTVKLARGQVASLHVRLQAASCAAGQHQCGGACADDTDPHQCGLACLACPAPRAHGTATCADFGCGVTCEAGVQPCGGDCVDITSDHDNCGQCGKACGDSDVCTGAQCQPNPCASGKHPCGGNCVADTDPAHCGSSCSPCPAPAGATATCDGRTCGLACPTGSHACGGACVASADVAHCGSSCTPCPVPTGAFATCNGVSCGVGCATGYHPCGGACADNTDVATCGASCTPCPTPANGQATCTSAGCGVSCDGGYLPCMGACVPQSQGCTATWVDRTSTPAPDPRSRPSMAYDAGRGVTVLFGGYNSGLNAVFADTWEWNGTAWRQLAPATVPSARSAAAFAYDAARGECLLFGGEDLAGNPVADTTWAFDGTTWSPRASGPAARSFAAAAWDDDEGVVLVFGGQSGPTFRNDLWSWNGSTWRQRTPTGTPPAARSGAAVTYDATRAQLLVFGGTDVTNAVLGDTWVTDLVTWSPVTGSGPSGREGSAAAFDALHGAAVLFGGLGAANDYPQDAWAWDGGPWKTLTTTGGPPPGRWRAGLVYDSDRGVLVLFGGASVTDYLQDTWELSW
ncbi:MAG TPA: kelch repeat-containing protein [Polyangia bacterium]|jgi:hypothetical protein